jgi:hypothetical protein
MAEDEVNPTEEETEALSEKDLEAVAGGGGTIENVMPGEAGVFIGEAI